MRHTDLVALTMPIAYEIDCAGVVWVTMIGEVTLAETIDHLELLARDPELRPGAPYVIDLRGLAAPAPVDDLERVATALARLRHRFGGARFALVVDTPVMFGAARQFGTLAERAGVEATPFRSERDARSWLGVSRRSDY